LCHVLRPHLASLEVENRLLPEPWPAPRVVAPFLCSVASLHRLERLSLLGVDLRHCGPSLGGIVGSPHCQISWLSLSFCDMDAAVMSEFGQALGKQQQQERGQRSTVQNLYLYEVGMTDEMLQLLVHQGFKKSKNDNNSSALRELHLARNQLTFQSLDCLSDLLRQQPQLQVLSVSHNGKLFSDPPSRAELVQDMKDDNRSTTHKYHQQSKRYKRGGTSTLTWLPAQNHPELKGFLAALWQHTGLLHFWAQSSSPAATQYPTTGFLRNLQPSDPEDWARVVEEFCAPLLQRNRLLQYVPVRPKNEEGMWHANNNNNTATENHRQSTSSGDVPPLSWLTIDTTATTAMVADPSSCEYDQDHESSRKEEEEAQSLVIDPNTEEEEEEEEGTAFNDVLCLSLWSHALQRLGRCNESSNQKYEIEDAPRQNHVPPRDDDPARTMGGGGVTPVYAFLHCRMEALWVQYQNEPIVMKKEEQQPLTCPNGDPKLKSD